MIFFATERIRKNYVYEGLRRMHMCVHGAGTHLCCVNKFCNTFICSYVNIYHREKYPLYGTVDMCSILTDVESSVRILCDNIFSQVLFVT